jgi:branched-chain amino acid transport system substrate-binding protein
MTRWAAALATAVVAISACGGSSSGGGGGPKEASGSPYTIGVVVSLTGTASQLGIGEKNAAVLAADQITKAGGINGHKLVVDVRDDLTTPAQSLQAARDLLQGKVVALIGPTVVADCNAVIPLVETSGPIQYCLSPGISPKDDTYVWSASVATAVFAQRMIGYFKSQNLTKIGLITTTDASGIDGGKAARSAVQALGGMQITADVQYDPKAVDAISQLQQIKSSGAQAIVVWSTGTPAGIALKGIQQLAINVPVATTNGNLSYDFVKNISAYTPSQLYIPATTDFWWDKLTPGTPQYKLEKSFHEDYQKAYGSQPDFGPGVGYDATYILADVLRHAGTDPPKMKAYMQSMKGFVGVQGVYTFAPNDHRGLKIDDVAMVQVKNGGFSYIGK